VKHKTMALVIVLSLTFPACSSGVRLLGKVKLPNGETRTYIQIGSKGHDSPRITVIESFQSGKLQTSYQASGRGMVEVVVDGPVRDAVAAAGRIGAASLLRPSKITVTQKGGGATSSAAGGKGGAADAGATSTADSDSSAEGGSGGSGGAGGAGGDGGAGGSSEVSQSTVQETSVSTNSEQTSTLNSEQTQEQTQEQAQEQDQGQEQAQEQEQEVE